MVNPNKLQKDNYGPFSSKNSLSDLRPRLLMRAAAGNAKINEEALNLIQQQQQPYEDHGQDLIQSLTQFVGPDGLMKNSVDILGYAELMQCEVSSSHQMLLLKILIATLKNDSSFSQRLVECEGILFVFGLWLNSVEPEKLSESLLIEKLLEILSRLTFTVELLVKHKYGRVIKKITHQQGKTPLKSKSGNYEIAVKLFEDWSVLANKSETTAGIRRKSFDDNSISDLQMLDNSMDAQLSSFKRSLPGNFDQDEEVRTPKSSKKRRVNFPDSQDKLCKVIIFERAPEEYEFLSDGSAARDNYLHSNIGEASLAFSSTDEYDDPAAFNFKPWTSLQPIEGLPDIERPEGNDSEEKIIQQQRERTVLSVNYYSFSDIPPCPAEADVDDVSDDSFTGKIIPTRANESILKQYVSIKSAPAASGLMIPSELLTNFMTSSSSYKAMLNPFVTSNNNSSLNSRYEEPLYQPPVRSYYVAEPAYQSPAPFGQYNPFEEPLYQPSTKYREPKHSVPENWNPYRRDRNEQYTQSGTSANEQQGYSSRSVCRFYRAGKRNSCKLGSDCKFLHQN